MTVPAGKKIPHSNRTLARPSAVTPTRPRYARAKLALAVAVIVLAVGAAYFNALFAPFVFDDQFAIVDNPTIRHLAQWQVLQPPPDASGAAGRPLVNLSLAFDYALSGLDPRGYHLTNLWLHALCGLTLFGLLHRTLEKKAVANADLVALAAAVVWSVHPLLTESVTCVIQRTEVLGGLCFLLTLYCFARGTESPHRARWFFLTMVCCLLGMAAKEIMVSAPLVVLLYDRTFVAGTFRLAWRERRRLYLGLAGTWLLLACLMVTSRQRGGTVGFGLGVSSWDYLLTQCRALVIYLKLSLWPHPLLIDYGTEIVRHPSEVALQGVGLILLAAITVVGIWRRPALGFLGAVFFMILAPSSSIVPLVTQPIAEHRMYLPLATIVVLVVVGSYAVAGPRSLLAWPVVAVALGGVTFQRNRDYRDELPVLQEVISANPHNDRGYLNLGTLLARKERPAEAITYYEQALRIDPTAADTHFNLAGVLEQTGRVAEAIDHYQQSVRLKPSLPISHYLLGLTLAKTGRFDEAVAELEKSLALQPDSSAARQSLALAHFSLADTRAQAGRMPEAITHYEAGLQLEPNHAQAHNNLGNALAQIGRHTEATTHYLAAVRTQPSYAEAHFNLAAELFDAGRFAEAKTHCIAVLRLKPNDEPARAMLQRIERQKN